MYRFIVVLLLLVITHCACRQNNSNESLPPIQVADTILQKDSTLEIIATAEEDTALSADPVIDKIRKEYRRVQTASLRKKEENYLPPQNSEARAVGVSGKVTWFYDDDELVKILDEGTQDHGEWKEEFYYDKGELFFIYVNRSGGGAGEPVWERTQDRVYVHEGKVYKYLPGENFALDEFGLQRLLRKGLKIKNAKTGKEVGALY